MFTTALVCALYGLLAAPPALQSPEAPPRTLTFVQAVEAGLAYNISIGTATARASQAQGHYREVLAQALPTLTAQGSYGHLDHDRELAGRVLVPAAQMNGNVTLVVPLLAARAWGNVAEARAANKASVAELAATRRDVAIGVALAYLDVVAQGQTQAVLDEAVTQAQGHFNYAQSRLEAGLGNRLDALRAGQELAQCEVQQASHAAAWLSARELLGQWVGYAGPIDAEDDVFVAAPPTHPEALATLTQRRVDLQATLTQLLQAQQARQNGWLDFMPNLFATGQIFGQTPSTPTAPNFGWQVQLLLSVPLYDGGARYGRAQQRRAAETGWDLQLNDGLRRAHSEVRTALGASGHAERALLAAERGRAQATEARKLAQAAYARGLRQNLEVIDAERQARAAATQAVLAHNTLRRAQVMLAAAMGQFP